MISLEKNDHFHKPLATFNVELPMLFCHVTGSITFLVTGVSIKDHTKIQIKISQHFQKLKMGK